MGFKTFFMCKCPECHYTSFLVNRSHIRFYTFFLYQFSRCQQSVRGREQLKLARRIRTAKAMSCVALQSQNKKQLAILYKF